MIKNYLTNKDTGVDCLMYFWFVILLQYFELCNANGSEHSNGKIGEIKIPLLIDMILLFIKKTLFLHYIIFCKIPSPSEGMFKI